MNIKKVNKIPVFIINLKKREDRRESIVNEFKSRDEFIVNIIEAFEQEHGAMGLWSTICHILGICDKNDPFIVICEDDHIFTNEYNFEQLYKSILNAQAVGADVLLGGISWTSNSIPVQDNIMWLERFSGTQFMCVFRKFFSNILNASFSIRDSADFKFSELSNRIFTIHPFISVQKEFGYSDVTSKNNEVGRVNKLFEESSNFLNICKKVFYSFNPVANYYTSKFDIDSYADIQIPLYILADSERVELRARIKKEMKTKKEFKLTFVNYYKRERVWEEYRYIIEKALETDEEVIIICNDEHKFTEHYSKFSLLKNIFISHMQGAEILFGCVSSLGMAIPVGKDRFWINEVRDADFIILFNSVFNKLLVEPYNEHTNVYKLLSLTIANKMVIYPFISTRKKMVTHGNDDLVRNNMGVAISEAYKNTEIRMEHIISSVP